MPRLPMGYIPTYASCLKMNLGHTTCQAKLTMARYLTVIRGTSPNTNLPARRGDV